MKSVRELWRAEAAEAAIASLKDNADVWEKRALAAEAKLAEATIKLRLLSSEAAWREGARMLQEADRARKAAEAEVERLREVIERERNGWRCTCDAAWKDRRKVDPECYRCSAVNFVCDEIRAALAPEVK